MISREPRWPVVFKFTVLIAGFHHCRFAQQCAVRIEDVCPMVGGWPPVLVLRYLQLVSVAALQSPETDGKMG